MRGLVMALLTIFLTTLFGGFLKLVDLGKLAEILLPLGVGFLTLVFLKMLKPGSDLKTNPLREELWKGIIFKIDERPPIRLEVRESFHIRPPRNK